MTENGKIVERHVISIGISTFIAVGTLITMFMVIIKPLIKESIVEELAKQNYALTATVDLRFQTIFDEIKGIRIVLNERSLIIDRYSKTEAMVELVKLRLDDLIKRLDRFERAGGGRDALRQNNPNGAK